MRALIVLIGLLIATPALASDGTYRGSSSEVISGTWHACLGETWEFNVAGHHVKASRVAVSDGGPGRFWVRMEGEIQADGSVAMSGSTPYGADAGEVRLTGKFIDGSFEGITQTAHCAFRITATKTSW
jgi:hypothetical protein